MEWAEQGRTQCVDDEQSNAGAQDKRAQGIVFFFVLLCSSLHNTRAVTMGHIRMVPTL
jgi:hypothetical protein